VVTKGNWLELNIGSLIDSPIEYRGFRINSYETTDGPRIYHHSPLRRMSEIWKRRLICDPAWQPQLGDDDYYVDYGSSRNSTIWSQYTAALVDNSLLHSYLRLLHHVPTSERNKAWPSGASSQAEVIELIRSALQLKVTQGVSSKNLEHLRKKAALLRALEQFDEQRAVAEQIPPPPQTAPEPPDSETAMARDVTDAEDAPVAAEASPPSDGPSSPEPEGPESRPGVDVHRDFRLCQALWASLDDEFTARTPRNEDWYIVYPAEEER
jgi:hypothetical protein